MARNAEAAGWCTQCFAALPAHSGGRSPEQDAGQDGEQDGGYDGGHDGEGGASPVPVRGSRESKIDDGARDVRVRDGEVQWRCARCAGWAELQAADCPACGAPRVGFGAAETHAPRRQLTPASAAAASLLPGLGHLLLGLAGTGVARMLLWVLWLGGGIALLRDGALAPGAVLLAGAVVLWLLTAADAAGVASGGAGGRGRQLLDARRLGMLAIVVTGGLMVTATVAVVGSS